MDGIVAPPSPALTDDSQPVTAKRQKTTASQTQSDTPGAALSHPALRREEGYVHKPPAAKKVSENQGMAVTVQNEAIPTPVAKPAKGRRRFMADLRDAVERVDSGEGYVAEGYMVQGLKSGEDDAILCDIFSTENGDNIVSLSLNVSDSSEYPKDHSFFAFTQDEGGSQVSQRILNVIETIPDMGSRSIDELLKRLVGAFARAARVQKGKGKETAQPSQSQQSAENDTDTEGDDEDVAMYDMDDDESMTDFVDARHKNIDGAVLLRDFNEIVAGEYRPGFIRVGTEDFALSISLPSFKLAESIAPRALMAWDPRLLSTTRHLTLLITGMRNAYPVLTDDGSLNTQYFYTHGAKPVFRVGLSKEYKPSREAVKFLIRNFDIKERVQLPTPPEDEAPTAEFDYIDSEEEESNYEEIDFHAEYRKQAEEREREEMREPSEEEQSFIPFSLSSSLESLLNDRFLDVLHYRIKYGVGWAGAEVLVARVQRRQKDAGVVIQECLSEIQAADEEEARVLARSYHLPPDPLKALDRSDAHLNLPLLAFSYLIRRLTLCSRFCLVCYQKLETDFQALKPYVCPDKLCTYQYYNLNRGLSLEYEICSRPHTVDLLVSLAYCAASQNALEDFPLGMHITLRLTPASPLVEFDQLKDNERHTAIMTLLDMLPSIADMKRHLEKRTQGRQPRLQDVDPGVPPAAWSLLRWCVASCTAHLEEISEEGDLLGNVGSEWKQFRFTVGAPDAEAKFKAAQLEATKTDTNAAKYPSLFAWHGSPIKNWHSIIRHGLWFKKVANGRAYGDGVYFAKDQSTSVHYMSQNSGARWKSASLNLSGCMALAEIVNLPDQFTSQNPHFVVQHTNWIVCRYLLVRGGSREDTYDLYQARDRKAKEREQSTIPSVDIDPKQRTSVGNNAIVIPQPSYRVDKLLHDRLEEHIEEDYDDEDITVFAYEDTPSQKKQRLQAQASQASAAPAPTASPKRPLPRPLDDWQHDPEWVRACVHHMLPAPEHATHGAVTTLQRELRAMLAEQEAAPSLKTLGWYMPPEFIGDNLFQWVVELHSFEEELPVAQDLKARNVNSLVFEIRFPQTFPHSPPFFRILKPRFLPFIHGGGGHVTGGGSMCMDLLTADGWLPSYSISAVLLQIKLAISNLDPRPARLAQNWDQPYTMQEALAGYKRAAQAHGWRIPASLDAMTA